MSDEREVPTIGDCRAGSVLVCLGDDRPDQWVPWLESLVDDFEALETTANEHDLELHTGTQNGELSGWQDFCEASGIDVRTEFWEGSMTSGQYVMGWLNVGKVRSAQKEAKELLKQLQKSLLGQLRAKRIAELVLIKDLDLLIERTCDDREALLSENAKLKIDLEAAHTRLTTLREALAETKNHDTSELTLECLRVATAVLNRDRNIFIAGPMVLWSDGMVYVFTSRGGAALPADSAPAILVKELQRAGHAVVEVGERTFVGGYLNPHLLEGTPHISGWINLWRQTESCERVFLVANPEQLTVVRQIHEHFKTRSPA
jgi:hypothetical protein